MQTFFQYKGVLHVHSTYSDGQKTIPEIAAIANELDLDFLLMTDHNTLQSRLDGLEGWYGHVLLGIGSELNDADDKNHYMAFNINEPIPFGLSAESYVNKVKEQGGFGIIAHPDESRAHLEAYPPYPWTIWESADYDGIEIWNHMSEWMEGLTNWNKFWRFMHPRRSIVSPKKETLQRWDQLNQKRKVVAVGGVDAHGFIYRIWGFIPLRVFRYKISFRTIRTHVLVKEKLPADNPQKALNLIYEAIRSGRSYVAHNLLVDASGFYFNVEYAQGVAEMGDSLAAGRKNLFLVQAPAAAQIVLLKDGSAVEQSSGTELRYESAEPGIYRVEVRRQGRPWIFSNQIRVLAGQ